MRAYSMDLRVRALRDSDGGMKADDVAAKYQVSGSWVRLLKQRRRETGEVAPRPQHYGPRPKLAPHLQRLAQPDPRPTRIARWSNSRRIAAISTSVSRQSGARWMRSAGSPSYETVRASEHDRPDIRASPPDLAGRHAADRSRTVCVSR